jgi:MscS family membrane protein
MPHNNARLAVLVFAFVLAAGVLQAQPAPHAPATTPAQPEAATDPLGRSTPRGTVLGFLNAGRKGDDELARQYLDTRLNDDDAKVLAHQLFVVLDARLPARLAQVSDAPEGSRSNPLTPNRELVGTITSAGGNVDILLERIARGKPGEVWLFSRGTLASIPAIYEEISQSEVVRLLPRFLTTTRLAGVRLFEWLALLLGIPLFYLATVLLNRVLTPVVGFVWRVASRRSAPFSRNALPIPVRLLILAIASRWLLSSLPLSLLIRQVLSNAASLITIAAIVWLLMLGTGEIETYIHRRVPQSNAAAGAALVRLLRRTVDVLLIFAGLLATLRHFGVDPTPALAGLGVGGIAVALAAQKTLENVIAGASLIFDQAVRVGDFLKMGDVAGTVDHIGLRSTRIRTLDRTVVSVPNSQIANASLETISSRDKFWFHPVVGVRYETTSEQLHDVVEGIRRMLHDHPSVDRTSVRVRFFRLGSFSLDIDVFAYVFAHEWNNFLEIQEQLLFGVTEIVEKAGTAIAFPSQTMYVENAPRFAESTPNSQLPTPNAYSADRR